MTRCAVLGIGLTTILALAPAHMGAQDRKSEAWAFTYFTGNGEEGLNHRIYGTTTRDFWTFSPTRLFYEPGFNVIDATIVRDVSVRRTPS